MIDLSVQDALPQPRQNLPVVLSTPDCYTMAMGEREEVVAESYVADSVIVTVNQYCRS